MTKTKGLKPGDTFTVLKAGQQFLGDIRRAGEVIKVTATDVAERADALTLVLDVPRQIEKWGEQRLAVEVPEDFRPWTYGDPVWAEQREIARKAAWSHQDHKERAAALAAVESEFGPMAKTSRSGAGIDNSAAVEEQRSRLDALRPKVINKSMTISEPEAERSTPLGVTRGRVRL